LREIEGCESQEVSEILGIPEATVRTRVFNARRKLQALLADPSREGGSG
jgi:RNA polymerase sigma-70 factor, ECF subfamily